MTVKKVKYNDTFIYIDDELNEEETGIALPKKNESLDDTIEIKPISDEDLLSDTIVDVDLFGGKDEK